MENKYVFKRVKGKLQLVGDFDSLYKEELNPWGQDGSEDRMREYYYKSREVLREVIKKYKGHISEVGWLHR